MSATFTISHKSDDILFDKTKRIWMEEVKVKRVNKKL